MTTIVYNPKERVIAYDSRVTSRTLIMSDKFDKMQTREDGVVFISCGNITDINLLIAQYPYDSELPITLNAEAFVIDRGRLFVISMVKGHMTIDPALDDILGIGSGGDFAMAAVDLGYSAKDAIKYAKTRDCATGGKVRTYKIKDVKGG